MKAALKVTIVAFSLAVSLTGCSHFASWRPGYETHRETLSNGLTVVYVIDHTAPIVSYSTWFKVGSAWERPGATGIAHLFEHMMFKGTKRFPRKTFVEELERRGATVNAFTQRDATVYYEIIASKHLENVLDMESDRLRNLEFSQADLDAERQVVKEERRLRVDSNFGEQQMEALDALAFPTHPYGRPVIGSMQDLDGLSLEQCRNFFRMYYQPGNAIVTIAGDFDYARARELMRKYYGSIAGHEVPALSLADEKVAPGEKRLVIRRPVESESLAVAYRIPSMYDKDAAKLSMLAWSLFGMGSSHARVELLRKKQLAIDVAADAREERYPYLFVVSAGMRNGETSQKAEAEIYRLIEEAKSVPPTDSELARVKNGLVYMAINEIKSPAGLANWLTWGEFYWQDRDKVFSKLDVYESMTPVQLMEVARKYLTRENRVVVVMRPEGGAK